MRVYFACFPCGFCHIKSLYRTGVLNLQRVRMKLFNYGPNMYKGYVSSHVELFSINYKCLVMIAGSPNWKQVVS
jgi:hypothetical protein